MIKQYCSFLLAICMILSLCACTKNNPSETSPIVESPSESSPSVEPSSGNTFDTYSSETSSTAVSSVEPEISLISEANQIFKRPTENIFAVYTGFHGMPAACSNGYYSGKQALRYMDLDSKQTIFLCSQPGCKHTDASCQAWIGTNVLYLCEYQGLIYAVSDEGSSVEFLKKDITTGQRTVLEEWKQSSDEVINISLGVFSDGKCALYYNKNVAQFDEATNSFKDVLNTQPLIYDLTTGDKKELPNEFQDWSVWGIYGNNLLMVHRDYKLSEDEYLEWYGDSTDYEAYLEGYIPAEIQLYNIDTGKSETIATEDDGLILTGDPCFSYGNTFIYQMGDDICLYDMDTQTSKVAITMERVINFWLLDHKIFLIQSFTGEPNEGCYIYYMDMDGGDLFRLKNEGDTDYMHFSITWEGNDYFGGNYNGNRLIRKEDFYADRYDQSWLGGY